MMGKTKEKKDRKYTKSQLAKAADMVKSCTMKISEAAREFDVPYNTLRNHLERLKQTAKVDKDILDSPSTALCMDDSILDRHFNLFEYHMRQLGLENKPAQIYNAAEIAFCMRDPEKVSTERRGTAFVCVSADGRVLSSAIIYQGGNIVASTFPRDCIVGSNEEGIMRSALFRNWFYENFLEQCGKDRPVLLICDRSELHDTQEVVSLAEENQITIMDVPHEVKEFLQPLDVEISSQLKNKLEILSTHNPLGKEGKGIIDGPSMDIWQDTVREVCTEALIIEGFKKCGLVPFNPLAVDRKKVKAKQAVQSSQKVIAKPEKQTAKKRKSSLPGVSVPKEVKKVKEEIERVKENERARQERIDKDAAKCQKCMKDDPPRKLQPKGGTVKWISCDSCERWFHYVCVGLKSAKGSFRCDNCTNSNDLVAKAMKDHAGMFLGFFDSVS